MNREIPTFNATLMGVSFASAEAKQFLDDAPLGTKLKLERDPTNEYDMNAIRVQPLDSLMHLGHVDRGTAADLAWWVDHDHQFTVELVAKAEGKARKHSLLITPIAA